LGDFNALAPGDYEDKPEALTALRSVEWTSRVASDGFQVVSRLVRRGYVDAGAASGPTPTFPSGEPLIRIDYIWASPSLAPRLRWCRPWQTQDTALASDHLPVLAEIEA
jgi:endonuclease/exonuclease/phosphatase family metal-dependent hydrolase